MGEPRFGFRRFVREAMAISKAPWPVAKMLRTGGSLALAFGLFAIGGEWDRAVLAAIFCNLLLFVDQGGPLPERLAVIGGAAAAMGVLALFGATFAGSLPLIFLTIFAVATGAGLVHSSLPGVEMIPRQTLICFVISAYLPQVTQAAAVCALVGTGCALLGALVESALTARVSGPRLAEARLKVIWPGPAFGIAYGVAAAVGLLSGTVFDSSRPYWVTITTLVVMQPGRRASALRAVQRFLGTLDGVVVAFLLALLLGGSTWKPALVLGIVLLPFLWPLGFIRNYGVGVAVISTWIMILLDLILPSTDETTSLFLARVVDTALGCGLSVLGTMLADRLKRARAAPAKAGRT